MISHFLINYLSYNIIEMIQQIYMTNINLIIIILISLIVLVGFLLKFKPSKQRKQKISVELAQIKQQTHDTIAFTFLLPSPSQKLGLKVGEHIEIEQNIKGQIVKRKYTPISPIDRVGSFVLLLKIYRPIQQFPNGGKMSCFLADLALKSNITITYPFGRFNYLGKCNTQITDFEGQVTKKKYKSFHMVAGGTGITPLFQIIQYCCENEKQDERPKIYVLFCNRTEHDILMKKELDAYAQKYFNIKIFYSVDKSVTADWAGFTGYVNQEKITKSMPEEIKSTLFLSCGPPPLCNGAQKIWKGLGIPNEQVYRF